MDPCRLFNHILFSNADDVIEIESSHFIRHSPSCARTGAMSAKAATREMIWNFILDQA
jgi:hypothetical protein